jgi:hypothetical protein
MSQAEAAKLIGLSTPQLISLESGEAIRMHAEDIADLSNWAGWLEIEDHPTVAELCFLARRRSGMSIRDVARHLNTSTTTFAKAEAEGDTRVRDFWVSQGYQFDDQ